MTDELEGCVKKWSLRFWNSSIFLEGMMETTGNLSQDSWCCGQNSNWVPPEYEV
jgi:hypothetical protein